MDVSRTQASTSEKYRLRMSYGEYLTWADEDTRAEWVNGEVIIHKPASNKHQRIILFLARLLATFVELFDRGLVQNSLFEVKLWPDGPSREPDLLFLARTHGRDHRSAAQRSARPDRRGHLA